MTDRSFRSCEFCRHYSTLQHGLTARTHQCALQMAVCPNASACSAYQPPLMPASGEHGTGYVWDAEQEGVL